MATSILLCSSKFVKDEIAISENIEDKYITTAIREAQDMQLTSILGRALTDKLKIIVSEDAAEDYPAYKTLLDDYISKYLGYMAMSKVCRRLAYKMVNAGVVTTSEENINPVSDTQVENIRREYEAMADEYCRKMQNYIIDNRSSYPELDTNTGLNERPQLYSSASSGIWLGGVGGR